MTLFYIVVFASFALSCDSISLKRVIRFLCIFVVFRGPTTYIKKKQPPGPYSPTKREITPRFPFTGTTGRGVRIACMRALRVPSTGKPTDPERESPGASTSASCVRTAMTMMMESGSCRHRCLIKRISGSLATPKIFMYRVGARSDKKTSVTLLSDAKKARAKGDK